MNAVRERTLEERLAVMRADCDRYIAADNNPSTALINGKTIAVLASWVIWLLDDRERAAASVGGPEEET